MKSCTNFGKEFRVDVINDRAMLKSDITVSETFNKVIELKKYSSELKTRLSQLNKELSKTNAAIQDIQHAAEFQRLNAAKGYKIYKYLHETRVKRRQIKDEILEIEAVLGARIDDKSLADVEKSIAKLQQRKYRPRVLYELFQ